MALSTRNIILIGDQMPLSQPIKDSHPGESGASTLEYLLQDHSTIPDDLGIFWVKHRVCTPRSSKEKLLGEVQLLSRTIIPGLYRDDAEQNLITLCAACHGARHAAAQAGERLGSVQQALSEIKQIRW